MTTTNSPNKYKNNIQKIKTEFNNEDKNYTEEMIKTERIPKINIKKNIIKRRGGDNGRDFRFHPGITYSKKLSYELDSLPENVNQFFRKSLDKYKFNLEVYVPNSMRISKKEYYNKDYMLNNLVKIQFKIEEGKNKIMKIAKETKKFLTQYNLVKNNNNNNKQNEYLLKLEEEYKNKKINEKFSKDENIFTPSILLDNKSDKIISNDIHSNNDFYIKENKKDKYILQKFYDMINGVTKKKDEDLKNLIKLDEKENKIEQIKNELKEQIKIKNMNQKEYKEYSTKIKKDIKKIKSLLDNGDYNISFFTTNNKEIRSYDKKKDEKIIDYKSKTIEKKIREDKIKDKINRNYLKNIKKKSMRNALIKNKINMKYPNLIDKIPRLELNQIIPKINIKETKEIKLNQLYNYFSERNNTKILEDQFKQLNKYFTKYSLKKLPTINYEKGNNMISFIDSIQNLVKNDGKIIHFSKLNENLKRDIYYNNNYIKNKDEAENLINIDNKILGLHYECVDNLLTNKKDKI